MASVATIWAGNHCAVLHVAGVQREHYVASEWRAQDRKYHFNEGRWEKDK